jgi:hypothetical protein
VEQQACLQQRVAYSCLSMEATARECARCFGSIIIGRRAEFTFRGRSSELRRTTSQHREAIRSSWFCCVGARASTSSVWLQSVSTMPAVWWGGTAAMRVSGAPTNQPSAVMSPTNVGCVRPSALRRQPLPGDRHENSGAVASCRLRPTRTVDVWFAARAKLRALASVRARGQHQPPSARGGVGSIGDRHRSAGPGVRWKQSVSRSRLRGHFITYHLKL